MSISNVTIGPLNKPITNNEKHSFFDFFKKGNPLFKDELPVGNKDIAAIGTAGTTPLTNGTIPDNIETIPKITGVTEGAMYKTLAFVKANSGEKSEKAAQKNYVPSKSEANLVMTETTIKNIANLMKGVRLGENILMVGPTAGGKTSLVKFLAYKTNTELRRVNLNDMTDNTELIGGFKPDPNGGFKWHDGIIVDAMKKGQWLLLDEINLAEQGILERINSLLDDDRYLVLTEDNNQVVKADPNFRIFATMNPSSYAGRKELSDAMKNRFRKVWIEPLKPQELAEILKSKSSVSEKLLLQMVLFHSKIAEMSKNKVLGKKGGPYPFTLRDLLKWAARIDRYKNVAKIEKTILEEGMELYYNRFADSSDRHVVCDQLGIVFGNGGDVSASGQIKLDAKDGKLQIGNVIIPINQEGGPYVPGEDANLTKTQTTLNRLEKLAKCVDVNEAILLVGPTASGKTSLVRFLAKASNNNIRRFNLGNQTDIMEFIGGYVPVSKDEIIKESVENLKAQYGDNNVRLESDDTVIVNGKPQNIDTKPKYKWKDGILIDAMKRGHWIILDEMNLAPAAILERINSLLDPDKKIVLTEKDNEIINAHPNFRIFATMNPATSKYGGRKEMSLAIRNRLTEIWFDEINDTNELVEMTNGWLGISGKESLAPKMVALFQKLKEKAEKKEVGGLKQGECMFTIRNLKSFARYINEFSQEEKRDKVFIDGALHCFALEMADDTAKKMVEELAKSMAKGL